MKHKLNVCPSSKLIILWLINIIMIYILSLQNHCTPVTIRVNACNNPLYRSQICSLIVSSPGNCDI